MTPAYLCAYLRTPIGRFGGALASVRADDLGAVPLRALMAQHPSVDWAALELQLTGQRRALATMCIGVGRGIALALERA